MLPLHLFRQCRPLCRKTAARCWSPPAPTSPRRSSLFRTPLGEVLPAEPTGRVIERAVQAAGDRARRAPSRSPRGLPGAAKPGEPPTWGRWFRLVETRPLDGSALMSGATAPPLLVLDRVRQGPRGAAAVRPGLAVGARLRRRRPAGRAAAPARPLADEGARLEEEYLKATADRRASPSSGAA